jgi:hypothetical protein
VPPSAVTGINCRTLFAYVSNTPEVPTSEKYISVSIIVTKTLMLGNISERKQVKTKLNFAVAVKKFTSL